VLDAPIIWQLAVRIPWAFSGRALHHAALYAATAGAYATAGVLFEHAAASYRVDLEVEPLARLRVHQLIARARAKGDPRRDEEAVLEIEQRLTRLDHIESLVAPFELVPARRLLATWSRQPRDARSGAPGGLPTAA